MYMFVWLINLTVSPGCPLFPGSPLAPHSPLPPIGPLLPGSPLSPWSRVTLDSNRHLNQAQNSFQGKLKTVPWALLVQGSWILIVLCLPSDKMMIKCNIFPFGNTMYLKVKMIWKMRKFYPFGHLWSMGSRVSPWSRISRTSPGALQLQKMTSNESCIIYSFIWHCYFVRNPLKAEAPTNEQFVLMIKMLLKKQHTFEPGCPGSPGWPLGPGSPWSPWRKEVYMENVTGYHLLTAHIELFILLWVCLCFLLHNNFPRNVFSWQHTPLELFWQDDSALKCTVISVLEA